jgi:hypothetical protein
VTRPSISRTLRALAAAGIKPAQITIHSDGRFDILTQTPPSDLDVQFEELERQIAQGRKAAR